MACDNGYSGGVYPRPHSFKKISFKLTYYGTRINLRRMLKGWLNFEREVHGKEDQGSSVRIGTYRL
jgi:hypothetical protein